LNEVLAGVNQSAIEVEDDELNLLRVEAATEMDHQTE
jgi:hypothetical protein